MSSSFELLDLPEDADERTIKRAYARLLKTVRPDEDPEGFQRLHEAYREALEACAWRAKAMPSHAEADAPPSDQPRGPAGPADAPAQGRNADPHGAGRDGADRGADRDTHRAGGGIADRLPHRPPDRDIHGAPAHADLPGGIADDALEREDLADIHPDHWPRPLPSPFAPGTAESDPWAARALAEQVLSMAMASDPSPLRAWLQVQPELWSLAGKAAVADAVVDALQFDQPPLTVAQFDALAEFFGLFDLRTGHAPEMLLAVRDRLALSDALDGGDLGAVAERLHQEGSPRAAQQREIRRLLQQLRRPWSWPQAMAMALVPGLPSRLHRFIQTLRGMGDGALPASLDPRQGMFWEAAGDRERWSWPRAAVLALRLALYPLALPLLSWLLQPDTLTSDLAGRRYLALFTALGLGWAGLRLCLGFAQWQAVEDVPDGDWRRVLRAAAIPLLLTCGLMLHFLPGTEPLSWLLVPPLLMGTVARATGSGYSAEALVLVLRNGWMWVAVPLALALFGAFAGSGTVRSLVYVMLAIVGLRIWLGARPQR